MVHLRFGSGLPGRRGAVSGRRQRLASLLQFCVRSSEREVLRGQDRECARKVTATHRAASVALVVLAEDVNRCVNNEFGHYYPIESIIEPSFYFGLSMSRIGADFRPQLIPIINKAIAKRFTRVVYDSTLRFEASIQSFTLTSHSINTSAPLLVGSVTDDQGENELIPPTSLLEFPLLAHYCNDILSAMNEIRRTTPLSIIGSLANTLNESFQRVSTAITKYFRTEDTGLSGSEREVLHRFCNQYTGELLPHLCKCFHRILPMQSVANLLGVSAIEFIKVKDQFPAINVAAIVEPINRLLPSHSVVTGDERQQQPPVRPSHVSTMSETTIGDKPSVESEVAVQ